MPQNLSAEQRLAGRILGQSLADWVQEQRYPFPKVKRSWEDLARQLEKATDGEVSVSRETLRKWNRDWVQETFVDRLEREVGAA